MQTRFDKARLIIFDIDGTLLATNEFWLEVGRRAVTTVFERHGILDELPGADRFLGAIGQPMGVFWHHVLPEKHHGLAEAIEAESQELEEAAFARGMGGLYPGARELMVDLFEAGRTLALASNCGRRYLAAFIQAFELAPLLAEARCVDSPDIHTKADMIGDIRRCTRVEPSVMIGDRDSDRAAAAAHGVPFILFTGGFSPLDPSPGDSVAASYADLRGLLLA